MPVNKALTIAVGTILPLCLVLAGHYSHGESGRYSSTAVAAVSDTGARQACIAESEIKNVSFEDDQRALLAMDGSEPILMTLSSRCQGIRLNGYVHRSNNNTLCRGDVLRVLESGGVCIIESLEPYAASSAPAR